LAQRIENYRVAGGKFKVKSDLKKIYGMPDSLFIVLEPFIQIAAGSIENRSKVELGQRSAFPTFAQPSKSSNLASEYNEVVRVEINSADTLELRKLKGIGPSYSNRIVKYREALGGFVTLEQIKEVYGISDSLFSQIASNIYLETMEVRSVNINIATFKELNSHPYISFEQTKDILNLKSKNGKFSGLDDLMKLKTFDSLQIAKLYPYLKF
jgi:competence ComEA-like helix-hairpin-helix protein